MMFRRRTLPGCEVIAMECTGHSFPRHAHEEFVVSVNLCGRERVWLEGRTFEAGPSDVTLYNPGEVQSGDAGDGPWSMVSLHLDPGWVGAWLGEADGPRFERPVLGGEAPAAAVRHAAGLALDPDSSEDEIVQATMPVVDALFRAAGAAGRARPRSAPPPVARVAEQLLATMAEPPTLGDLSAEAGLSPVQLVRGFARAFGLPPFVWLNVRRLEEARRRLAAGERAAIVAADLGFADQAHFSRRFRAMYGVPPGIWRSGEITFKTARGATV